MIRIFFINILISTFTTFAFSQAQKPLSEEKIQQAKEVGIANYWEGNFSVSIQKLSLYIKYKTEDDEAYFYRGLCRASLSSYSTALKDFEKAMEINDKNPDYIFKKGEALYYLKKWEDAELAFGLALEKAKENNETDNIGVIHYHRAVANLELGNRDAACSDLASAAKLKILEAKELSRKYCKDQK